ncbi:hypothetical protein UFOVP1_15 [uncultured Caudovirales phage]|uniref:Uncharacterized protein n=1 Tax=uncultured Caudovirales phage TaxID=2100421 RepID=A0A6J5KHB6_9CAUD|nr:hypothetical protein UFOVP1_15 [uncultured Caudovirales phage]
MKKLSKVTHRRSIDRELTDRRRNNTTPMLNKFRDEFLNEENNLRKELKKLN